MKTAISLAEDLFQAVDQLAQKEHLSRSEVFSRAVREYLGRRQNQQLLQELNQVYGEPDSREERTLKKHRKRYYTKVLKRNER